MRAMLRAPGAIVRGLGRLAGALAWLLVIGVGVFAALLLLVRMVVFPHIEHYRDTITAAIAAQIHQPVSIDTLTTAWDGWNPKLVITGFRIGPPGADAASGLLELPRVELTLAWTSVPLMEPRLRELVIDRPRLAVRRDAQGRVHVAGIEIDPATAQDDTSVTDWLLRQPEIVVRDALITWLDERRDAPQLVLDKVTFRLESTFGGGHRFGLVGRPPAQIAGPIDVRGDFVGRSFSEWQRADGQIYARLDYADIAAWREWLPLPLEIDRGEGALRAWFTFAEGQVREIVADVELADVQTRLARNLPPLSLAHVSGRAGWRAQRTAREVYCRQLAFTTTAGQAFAPTDLSLVMRTSDAGELEHGRLEFERVDLAPLREIAEHLPLTARWRADLVAFAPQGRVTRGMMQWDGPVDAPTAFEARADFANVGWIARASWPGASNVSGSLKATSRGGEVKIAARDASLAMPRVLPAPVPLDMVNGTATWTLSREQLALRIDDLTFANADAAGRVAATYRHVGPGPGAIDLDASLTRALPQAIPRYTPVFLSEPVRTWAARAIRSGHVDEVKLKLKGDLAAFPFPDDGNGVFAIDFKGRDFTLDYADGWPAITNLDGEVHFHGAGLRVDGSKARVYGVDIGRTTAEIADMRAPVLAIDGNAAGPTREFLRFVDDSPVHDWIDDFTRNAEASGDASLALKLSLPLHEHGAPAVSGELTLANDQVKLPGVPALAQVNGKVAFNNREVHARDVTAEALGGPVRIAVAVSDGRTRIAASGNANLQAVRREFPFPLAQHAAGNADWSFSMDTRNEVTTWSVESPLKGVAIDLPAPLGKTAAEARPLRIERRPIANAKDEDT
ncbi:MAG TPA: DUF3971 domain-containing protein, partial [Casimicrobiaceae bacterium]|nr:DUF3971 domain-containing protein [Casimicrobiaceae bacterium]